jgi:NADH-quinone oxidoreductase subunit N
MDFLVIKAFIPEVFLSFCILFQLIYNAILINNYKNRFPILSNEVFLQTIFILGCLLLLLLNLKCEVYIHNFLFLVDTGNIFLKMLLVISSGLILLGIMSSFNIQSLNFFEYFTLYLLSIFSLLLLIGCSDMLSTYLVIEMQALCFYVLACFKRDSAFSTEAGLKYFVSGSFISAIFLCGCSIVYGLLGTLNFNQIYLLFSLGFENFSSNFYLLLLVGNLLIIITFLFKLAVVPFHFWAPDVYEGSPLASTVIFSLLPKISLIFFLAKWLLILGDTFKEIFYFLELLGVLSVALGIGFAVQQNHLKRLMIYSSISQLGFLIAALANINANTLVMIYFFLIIYIISSLLIWLFISSFYFCQNIIRYFYKELISTLFLTSLTNLVNINPVWSYSLLVIFFSIAGLPPFCGFLAKIFIIFNIIESKNLVLALILIIISLISAFYYLRFLKVVFFEPTSYNLKNSTAQIVFINFFSTLQFFLIASLIYFIIFLFFNPDFLILCCHKMVFNIYFS